MVSVRAAAFALVQGELQAQWRSDQAKRALLCTDVVASFTTLAAAIAAYARLLAETPGHNSVWTLLQDAGVFITQLLIAVNAAAALLTLLLITHRTHAYYRYRLQLCGINRLLRLLMQCLAACSPVTLGSMAWGVTSRSLFLESPGKGLAVVLFHPLAFSMQAALFVLPLWCTLVLQLFTTAAALVWSRMLPCILQHAAAETRAPTHLVAAAEYVCTHAQSMSVLAHAAAAQPGVRPPGSSAVCTGVTAVQTLHIVCSLCCLLLLPVTVVCVLDAWLRTSNSAAPNSTAIDWTAVDAGSIMGSSNASSSRWQRAHKQGSTAGSEPDEDLDSSTPLDALLASVSSTQLPVNKYYLVLLAPVVLALVWGLSELLSSVFMASVDCADVLTASGLVP